MKVNELRVYDVAIVGMAGRFPKAKNIEEFWVNLVNGRDCITRMEDAEVEAETRYAYGSIENPFHFDNEFFDINQGEASKIPPQERLLLQIAYETLEDAGCVPDEFKGKIGIVCGAAENDYRDKILMAGGNLGDINQALFNGSSTASRVSYKLNLKGPCVYELTACATSLSAVHLAVSMLQNYEADAMLAGGTNVNLDQDSYSLLDGVLSKDGYTRAFDKEGTGFVPGNAVAMVLLKRIEDAIRDKDHIYAVIKGSAIGNDGNRKVGFTAPSVAGEMDVINSALDFSEIHPSEVDYIETHGTATPIGDAVEIQALKNTYGSKAAGKRIAIGSLKNNFGHLNVAAGIAGLIKGALVLNKGIIPPTINIDEVNEELKDCNSLYVNKNTVQLDKREEGLRHVGVSSFGIGGLNAHVIMEEYRKETAPFADDREQLFVLSSNSKNSLKMLDEKYKDWIDKHSEDCPKASWMLINFRNKHKFRKFEILKGKDVIYDSRISQSRNINLKDKIVFMFPGAGAADSRMGLQIYNKFPLFKKYYDECRTAVLDITNGHMDISCENYAGDISLKIVSINYSMAKAFTHMGVEPDLLVGHSLGEYSMAMFNGVLSLKDGLNLVHKRSKLIEEIPDGKMVSVAADCNKVREILPDTVYISCINARDRMVLACLEEHYDELVHILDKNEIKHSLMATDKPGHTQLVKMIEERYLSDLNTVNYSGGKYQMLSTLYGKIIPNDQFTSPRYWMDLMEKCVLFSDAVDDAIEKLDGNIIFIEMGANDSLSTFVNRECIGRGNVKAYASMKTPEDNGEPPNEWLALLRVLGELWKRDVQFNSDYLFEENSTVKLSLPGYCFEEKYFNELEKYYLTKAGFYLDKSSHELFKKYEKEQDLKDRLKELHAYPGLVETYDRLCISAAAAYFAARKVKAGYRYGFTELVKHCGVIEYYKTFIEFLVQVLRKGGYAAMQGEEVTFDSRIYAESFEREIRNAEVIVPEFMPYVNLLNECVSGYDDVFTGTTVGNAILYPDGGFNMLEQIESSVPNTTLKDTYIRVLVQMVKYIIEHSTKKIRILEVGSGTGKLAWPILEETKGLNFEYWFTDIGRSFVVLGKDEAKSKNIKNMQFKIFDIEQNYQECGFEGNEFDIILALDVVQATSDIDAVLKNLFGLIKPLGYMIMVQSFWIHDISQMIFGFAPGWWNYSKDPLRRGKSIALDEEEWKNAFTRAGFRNGKILTGGHNALRREVGIITAIKPEKACVIKCNNQNDVIETGSIGAGEESDIPPENMTYNAANGFNTISAIKNIICQTLGTEDISIEDNIFDLGLDSLSILIIRSKIKEKFGYELSVKVFYECKSIHELACSVDEFSGEVEKADEDGTIAGSKKSLADLFQVLDRS